MLEHIIFCMGNLSELKTKKNITDLVGHVHNGSKKQAILSIVNGQVLMLEAV